MSYELGDRGLQATIICKSKQIESRKMVFSSFIYINNHIITVTKPGTMADPGGLAWAPTPGRKNVVKHVNFIFFWRWAPSPGAQGVGGGGVQFFKFLRAPQKKISAHYPPPPPTEQIIGRLFRR